MKKPELRSTFLYTRMPSFGITAATSHHGPNFSMPFLIRDFHKIVLVEAGAGILDNGTETFPVQEGMLLHIPPATPHCFTDKKGAPLTLSGLHFTDESTHAPKRFRKLFLDLIAQWPPCEGRWIANSYDVSLYKQMIRAMIRELGMHRPGHDVMMHAMSMQYITTITYNFKNYYAGPVRMEDADGFVATIAYLDAHFNQRITIADLARRAGMSYRAYSSHFRKFKGMTVKDYLTTMRVEFAKRRLVDTGDILGSALEAGFEDLSNFYRTFKKLAGETPKAYLEQYRE